MDKCLNCGAELNHHPGRRKKSYCGKECKQKFFSAKPKIKKMVYEEGKIYRFTGGKFELFSLFTPEEFTKATKKRTAAPISKPVPGEQIGFKSRIVKDSKDLFTLEKIKSMCPPELKGMERNIWIQEQKEIHGL